MSSSSSSSAAGAEADYTGVVGAADGGRGEISARASLWVANEHEAEAAKDLASAAMARVGEKQKYEPPGKRARPTKKC